MDRGDFIEPDLPLAAVTQLATPSSLQFLDGAKRSVAVVLDALFYTCSGDKRRVHVVMLCLVLFESAD